MFFGRCRGQNRIAFLGFIAILISWILFFKFPIRNNVAVDLLVKLQNNVKFKDFTNNEAGENLKSPTQFYHKFVRNIPHNAGTAKWCPNLNLTFDTESSDDIWRRVYTDKIYSYSAYFDDRKEEGRLVRIISIALRKKSVLPKLFCQLWNLLPDNSVELDVTPARLFYINECHLRRYCAAMILCKVGDNVPEYVSLVAGDRCQEALDTATLKVKDDRQRAITSNFTVCLGGPLKLGYNNVNNIVQWLEVNSMFGADKFVMYNHSGSSDIGPYIKSYIRENKLEFIQWKIPVEGKSNLKNYGQLAVINDCIYRNMYNAKYVVIVDIDEYIVPRIGNDWWAIIRDSKCREGSYNIVRSSFFHMEWPDDKLYSNNSQVTNLGLNTLLKTKRSTGIYKMYVRSKYIVPPTVVEYGGVHCVHKTFKLKRCSPKPDVALVHHYRLWEEEKLTADNFVDDRKIHEYEKEIIARTRPRHRDIDKFGDDNKIVL